MRSCIGDPATDCPVMVTWHRCRPIFEAAAVRPTNRGFFAIEVMM
jgi:hypothetical protein